MIRRIVNAVDTRNKRAYAVITILYPRKKYNEKNIIIVENKKHWLTSAKQHCFARVCSPSVIVIDFFFSFTTCILAGITRVLTKTYANRITRFQTVLHDGRNVYMNPFRVL